jgi:hypothetical protein
MNLYNHNNIASLPSKIVLQPPGLLSMPRSVEINDYWRNGGSGIGCDGNATRAALGEYFERRHFYMEIWPDTSGTLDSVLPPKEVEKFTVAFVQTAVKKITKKEIRLHTFNLTKVYRTSDFSSCHIPTACISLSAHNIAGDSFIYPLRDTCGCCFHSDPNLAILGSLKEQLERQFLAKFWLTKKCNRIISNKEAINELKKFNSLNLYNYLRLSGDLTIIDISDQNFPGKSVLTVYGNSDPERHVKYCAGMAYAATEKEAIDKSILELWQTYRFMDLHGATQRKNSEIEDPYLQHFLNCNSFQTYQTITEVECSNITPSPLSSEFSISSLLGALNASNIIGYLYIKTIKIENNNYYLTKYVSTDLFLHMNNSQNINIDNTYSSSFRREIYSDRISTMVPFP